LKSRDGDYQGAGHGPAYAPAAGFRPVAGTTLVMDHSSGMSRGATVAIGAVIGLVAGIVVSVTTDLPLAPEAGAVVGALGGWVSRRDSG
jgi:hypothetical protein